MKEVGFAYDFSPIQQLARYHLVIIDILRDLRTVPIMKNAIVAMSKAESDWKNMMDKVYAARNFSLNRR